MMKLRWLPVDFPSPSAAAGGGMGRRREAMGKRGRRITFLLSCLHPVACRDRSSQTLLDNSVWLLFKPRPDPLFLLWGCSFLLCGTCGTHKHVTRDVYVTPFFLHCFSFIMSTQVRHMIFYLYTCLEIDVFVTASASKFDVLNINHPSLLVWPQILFFYLNFGEVSTCVMRSYRIQIIYYCSL